MDLSTIPTRAPVPVEDELEEDGHWLRGLLQTEASSWVVSIAMHLCILVILAFLVINAPNDVDVVTVLEAEATDLEFEDGETLGDPNGDLTEALIGGEQLVTETPGSEGFATTPVVGLSEMNIPPLDLGISSDFGTIMQAGGGGGTGGDPGRIGEIDRRVAQGGGGTGGALRVSLAWENMNDIDLHVWTPDGEEIYYGDTISDCGGELDVDANVYPETTEPVENIVWSVTPRDGEYVVGIEHFSHHPNQPGPTKCDILMVIGDEKRFLTVSLRPDQAIDIVKLEIENGQLIAFNPAPRVSEGDEGEADASAGPVEDEKREAQRQQFAQQALNEAMEADDPQGRAARLRRVIDRFPGTPAAEEAQQRLNEIESM